MKRKSVSLAALFVPLACLICIAVYFLPPIHERLEWRVEELILRIKYTLNPPQEVIFIPQEGLTTTPLASPAIHVTADDVIYTPLPTKTVSPIEVTPTIRVTPTVTHIPLPERVELSGVRYQDQHGRYNYCAPANLAMALSYWGWNGNQDVLGPVIKPDPKDRNVMPYEMVDYIKTETELSVVDRVGGDVDTIKRFLAAGFPVLVERGVYFRDLTGVVSWMGHFQVITGYDDVSGYFITQDSFMQPDYEVAYDEMVKHWRAFNYTYLVIYPPEEESTVLSLLGADVDVETNYENAALKASNEIFGLSGIDQYFAWYNRGTNLMNLKDYTGAAAAYDEAFAMYPTIPEMERPWRMLWYQTGPYFAYYFSQRYWDVLYLADGTLNAMQGERNLEESYYWRGRAKVALGDTHGATQDFLTSLEYHKGFEPAIFQLNELGVIP